MWTEVYIGAYKVRLTTSTERIESQCKYIRGFQEDYLHRFTKLKQLKIKGKKKICGFHNHQDFINKKQGSYIQITS